MREGGGGGTGASSPPCRTPRQNEAGAEREIDDAERQDRHRHLPVCEQDRRRDAERQLLDNRHRHQRTIALRIAADHPECELKRCGNADEAVMLKRGMGRRRDEYIAATARRGRIARRRDTSMRPSAWSFTRLVAQDASSVGDSNGA